MPAAAALGGRAAAAGLAFVAVFARPLLASGGEPRGWCSPSSGCCAVLLEVHLLSGQGVYSGTETGVTVAFQTGDSWTDNASLLDEIDDPDEKLPSSVEAMFRLPGWPKRLRIAAGGNDAFGYQLIEMSLPSGQKVTVLSAPSGSNLSYPASRTSPGYDFWVDGDETAAQNHVFDVPQDVDKQCFEVVPTEPTSTSTQAPDVEFDCVAGYPNWETGWSAEKKEYCCSLEDVDCTTEDDFDCVAGYPNWEKGWSAKKKEYCCSQDDVDCTYEVDFDCAAGYADWEKGWSAKKKEYCCSQEDVDCTTEGNFNCIAGYANWEKGWSAKKKEYCCSQEGVDCTTEGDFNCTAGYANWEKGWSAKKKEYCCSQEDVDCTPDGAYNCSAGYANWESAWTEKQKAWCCAVEHKGCELDWGQKYDCSAGDPDQVAEWREDKKFWCCSWETDGCRGGQRFDCKADLQDWLSRWSHEKIEWCCSNEHQGCAAVEETAPFNCSKDTGSWDHKWSQEQKEWCCAREQKGCAGPAAFDCDLGRSRSEAWSDAKRTWCSEDTCSPDGQLVIASTNSTTTGSRFGVGEVSTIVASGIVLGGSIGAVVYMMAKGQSSYSPTDSVDT